MDTNGQMADRRHHVYTVNTCVYVCVRWSGIRKNRLLDNICTSQRRCFVREYFYILSELTQQTTRGHEIRIVCDCDIGKLGYRFTAPPLPGYTYIWYIKINWFIWGFCVCVCVPLHLPSSAVDGHDGDAEWEECKRQTTWHRLDSCAGHHVRRTCTHNWSNTFIYLRVARERT